MSSTDPLPVAGGGWIKALAVIGVVLAAGACSAGDTGADRTAPTTTTRDTSAPDLPLPFELRPLRASSNRIVDDVGRDVLLRGVNITSLGEYWQGDPELGPTVATTDEDWEAMAARGLSVVRLVIHWSRIEPETGMIDESYLDAVDAYVSAAARHGIYTVLDMHQDAYSAFISTPAGVACPAGTNGAKGWDGAPAWAVFTDGLSTCTPGERNASPAVQRRGTILRQHRRHSRSGSSRRGRRWRNASPEGPRWRDSTC